MGQLTDKQTHTKQHTLADQSSLLRWMLFVLTRYITSVQSHLMICNSSRPATKSAWLQNRFTLDLAIPVPQGAHWLIRKQVRLADHARYHHALTVPSLGSDCQACTASLLS